MIHSTNRITRGMCFLRIYRVFFLQGAQTLYGTVVRPVFVNIHGGASRVSPTQSEPTVSADGLRERVAVAE